MKRNLVFLLFAMLVLAFSNSSQAQFPCNPGDSVDVCCGADVGLGGYSWDLGSCDTIYIEPWPYTDTCFDGTCINNPGENFPCFMYVNVFVTHDSNTFWWTDDTSWVQDSIVAFTVPLIFWHQPVSGMDADSVIFPFDEVDPENPDSWNNILINKYAPMGRSMFRHFVNTRADPPETTFNRMYEMVKKGGKAQWTVFTSFESHSSDGDSGHVYLNVVPLSPTCQRWWEGERVLLATYTFKVFMAEGDTTEICFDSTFWSPASRLKFTRQDGIDPYCPRHFLPKCFKVFGGTVTGVRWIEGSTEEESRPTTFSVSQNYPNPFNPVTNFRIALPQASHVKIEIFNILGQKMKTLVDEDMRAGVFVVDWDGKDDRGLEVSSGIYFYRIVAGEFSDIKKMVLLK